MMGSRFQNGAPSGIGFLPLVAAVVSAGAGYLSQKKAAKEEAKAAEEAAKAAEATARRQARQAKKAAEAASSSRNTWLWIGAGTVLAVGAVAFVARKRRRR